MLDTFNEDLGIDCYRAPFGEVAEKIGELTVETRYRFLQVCENAFSVLKFRTHEPTRVASARLLIALLPDSLDVIKRWVEKSDSRFIHEVHFSLFCYFGEVQEVARLRPARRMVLDLVAKYLMRTKTDAARAAWMAADLLGDHWNLHESLPVLINVAKDGQSVAARKAAVHGLTKALRRCSDGDCARITATLEQLASSDSSRKIRVAAKMSLGHSIEAALGVESGDRRT